MNQDIKINPGFGPWVQCWKMQGSGNDFALLDNRIVRLPLKEMPEWAKAVCRRAFGVGADGLILLDVTPPGIEADYIWHFFNADGSRAEMCGNGSRCAARLAQELGLAGSRHVLGTDAGPITAEVFPEQDLVKVQLTPQADLRLNFELALDDAGPDQAWTAHFVNTGVPHLVIFTPDVDAVDLRGLGRRFRNHPLFAPAGTNVNFVQVMDRGRLRLRTYERGVEDETYACGTGAAASAVIARALNLSDTEVQVETSGRERLQISLEHDTLFLTGKALLVFVADLNLRALGLE